MLNYFKYCLNNFYNFYFIPIKFFKYLGSSNNSNNVQGTINDKDQKGSKVSSVEKQVSNFNYNFFIDI